MSFSKAIPFIFDLNFTGEICLDSSLSFVVDADFIQIKWNEQIRKLPRSLPKDLVISTLNHLTNQSLRIHGRKTKVLLIDKVRAKTFLDENHIYGFVNGSSYHALTLSSEIVAVAVMGPYRRFKEPERISTELIRFAQKQNHVVVGGISKLIKSVFEANHFDEIMTYVDAEYSDAGAFKTLGFELVGQTVPMQYVIRDGRKTKFRPEVDTDLKVFEDLGNYKLIKKMNE